MVYTQKYASPLGGMLLAADEVGLTGLWFDGGKFFADNLPAEHEEEETPTLAASKRWLDIYFMGKEPDFTPPLHMPGTPFRERVWAALLEIPYGETISYGEQARRMGCPKGARAVGGANHHNPLPILIPCHRVVAAHGLGGYGEGIERKKYLLRLEGALPKED